MTTTATKDRSIIFTGDSVPAIDAGHKTQTRRVVIPQPGEGWTSPIQCGWYAPEKVNRRGEKYPGREIYGFADEESGWVCPYGPPGTLLWVRETWGCPNADHPRCVDGRKPTRADRIVYAANAADAWQWRRGGSCGDFVWRSPRYMPRWASRLTLEVTGVRVERLQDISESGARLEGCPNCPECEGQYRCGQWGRGAIDDPLSSAAGGRPWRNCMGLCEGRTGKEWFASTWDTLNGRRGFPWSSNPWVWVITFKKLISAVGR